MKSALFFCGLFLQVLGFLGDRLEHFSWLLARVAGKFARARSAFERLSQPGSVTQADPGFDELVVLFRTAAAEGDSNAPFLDAPVRRIERLPTSIALTNLGVGELARIIVHTEAGEVRWTYPELEEAVLSLKSASLLRFSAVVFALGVLVTLASFLINEK